MRWTCNEFGEERRRFHSLTMLATDANRVVGLRVMKLMLGGKGARREAQLMVSEKIDAAFKASASLMAGASGDEIVRQYRRLGSSGNGELHVGATLVLPQPAQSDALAKT
jgi:hypothetical protein